MSNKKAPKLSPEEARKERMRQAVLNMKAKYPGPEENIVATDKIFFAMWPEFAPLSEAVEVKYD